MSSDLPKLSRSARQEARAYHAAWRRVNPLKAWLHGVKSRAKAKRLAFNITLQDLEPLPKKCPVLGLTLDYSLQDGRGMSRPNKATIDRVKNTRGYVKGNVRVISAKANRLKSNMNRREASAVFQYMNR